MKSKYYHIATATILAMLEHIFDEAEQPIGSYSKSRTYLTSNGIKREYSSIYVHNLDNNCAIIHIGEEDSLDSIKERFREFKRDAKKIGITLMEKTK